LNNSKITNKRKAMAKGLLYLAQNEAFQHLANIGKTTKLIVEARGLSSSNALKDYNYKYTSY